MLKNDTSPREKQKNNEIIKNSGNILYIGLNILLYYYLLLLLLLFLF